MASQIVLTLGDVARHFGIQSWMVRRLFERGILPEPERVGSYRVFREGDLPAIGEALRTHDYLAAPAGAGGAA
jgi:DNA-binding transcriptional MerR regulator